MKNKSFKKAKNLALATIASAFLVGATTTVEANSTNDAGSTVTWKNADGHQLKDNWLYKYGNLYYFNKDGYRLTNKAQKIDGNTYYFGKGGEMVRNGFNTRNGATYYYDANGSQVSDYFYTNWGNTYYFGKDGKRYTNQFYTNWGRTYYFGPDGARWNNRFYNNWGHTYYFGADGARYTNQFYQNWGNTYYFGGDGALVTNQDITVNGVKYHADSQGVLTSENANAFTPSQINHTYDLASWEGSSQSAINDYIIMHDVGAESGAAANANYLHNNWESAYTQFVVGDGGQVFEVGEPGYVSWGALNANPYSPCQIELGRTYNRSQFIKDYTAYINVARYYAKQYGIPLTLDAGGAGTPGVKTHNWVTENIGGSHVDPYGYLASWGISYNQFANDIANGVNQQQLNSVVYSQRQ
ncbi:N-acetylmuramoyl-L-alanine amidase [Limosilactobacillus reuteri]|uniref:N-acetylmuramoyl-L-alanine amidase n=1 Tax=Limosilactobacillus reuteri TaxID=1598 RepID=UPI001E49881E|nr:N-acetylmuramoyl-L-alanine amidase [Limosilactobacillus reuteri]MCC4405587.1 N-acetylmuramoyl-L-alanine amidase [Limosilactobacillus reuteri]